MLKFHSDVHIQLSDEVEPREVAVQPPRALEVAVQPREVVVKRSDVRQLGECTTRQAGIEINLLSADYAGVSCVMQGSGMSWWEHAVIRRERAAAHLLPGAAEAPKVQVA